MKRTLWPVLLCSAFLFSPLASAMELQHNAETGVMSWLDGDFLVEAWPHIVTSSNPPTGGDRLTIAGDPSASEGIDVDGVGRLFLDNDPSIGFGSACSCSLLGDGRTLLTAAHCVTDTNGDISLIDGADGNTAIFDLPGGNLGFAPFVSSDVTVHPQYNGNLLDGYDVATIDLGFVLPNFITRYELNTTLGPVEFGEHVIVGSGRSGDGATGSLIGPGLERSGKNNFAADGLDFLAFINNGQTQLTADFDSGSAANDAFSFFIYPNSEPILDTTPLGFGDDEVGSAPGDSGGPAFINVDGQTVIGGVSSYGLRLTSTTGLTPDIDTLLNSSWGEYYAYARVADPEVLAFIEGQLIPEPSTAALLVFAAAFARIRR